MLKLRHNISTVFSALYVTVFFFFSLITKSGFNGTGKLEQPAVYLNELTPNIHVIARDENAHSCAYFFFFTKKHYILMESMAKDAAF